MQWGGHNYFLSWREPWHKFEDWDWVNGRNFCRDRCMDLVSFDTPEEHKLFAAIARQGQQSFSEFSQLNSLTHLSQFNSACCCLVTVIRRYAIRRDAIRM